MNNDDSPKKHNCMPQIILSIVTLIFGIAGLFFCAHMKSNLPSSAENLNIKDMDAYLKQLRILVSNAIPWMSAYLIFLSIAMWFFSRKTHK